MSTARFLTNSNCNETIRTLHGKRVLNLFLRTTNSRHTHFQDIAKYESTPPHTLSPLNDLEHCWTTPTLMPRANPISTKSHQLSLCFLLAIITAYEVSREICDNSVLNGSIFAIIVPGTVLDTRPRIPE